MIVAVYGDVLNGVTKTTLQELLGFSTGKHVSDNAAQDN
jgi:hypothetical protein